MTNRHKEGKLLDHRKSRIHVRTKLWTVWGFLMIFLEQNMTATGKADLSTKYGLMNRPLETNQSLINKCVVRVAE